MSKLIIRNINFHRNWRFPGAWGKKHPILIHCHRGKFQRIQRDGIGVDAFFLLGRELLLIPTGSQRDRCQPIRLTENAETTNKRSRLAELLDLSRLFNVGSRSGPHSRTSSLLLLRTFLPVLCLDTLFPLFVVVYTNVRLSPSASRPERVSLVSCWAKAALAVSHL